MASPLENTDRFTDSLPHVICIIQHLNVGGEEKLVAALMPALRRHGFRVSVITFMPGDLDATLTRQGVPVIPVYGRSIPTRLPRLIRLLGYLAPDLIHTRLFSAGFWGRLAAYLTTRAMVVHTHGGFTFREKRWKRLPMERLLFRLTHATLAVSNGVKQHLVEQGGLPGKSIEVIPNGIDPTLFLTRPIRLCPARKRVMLITVGSLTRVKGQDMAIRALARLPRGTAGLQVVGDGPEAPALRQLTARLGLSGEVEFMGQRQEIAALLASADLYVAPSRSEGLPLAVLEAMAAGLPVVATAVKGNREALADTGWLCPADDPDAMARTLRLVLDAKHQAAAKALAARERVCRHYTFSRMVAAHVQLYRRCLAASR